MEQKQSIEEIVIQLLESGSRPKTALIADITRKTGATIQGIYKALRSLREAEVITIHDKTVSLSFIWITAQLRKYATIAESYRAPDRMAYFLQLKPGEHVGFKFPTLRELDLFWTHAFLLLEPQISKATPAYTIAPHDWFIYARPSTDRAWVEQLEASTRAQRVIITHTLPLDKKVLVSRKSKLLEFVLGKNPLHLNERQYINVLHPWVFEAHIDKKTNEALVDWIKKHPHADFNNRDGLDNIFAQSGANTLKISCNPRRAESLARKVKKYFSFK